MQFSEMRRMQRNLTFVGQQDLREKFMIIISGGARGVIVIVVGNGHGDTSSNPGRDRLHFI